MVVPNASHYLRSEHVSTQSRCHCCVWYTIDCGFCSNHHSAFHSSPSVLSYPIMYRETRIVLFSLAPMNDKAFTDLLLQFSAVYQIFVDPISNHVLRDPGKELPTRCIWLCVVVGSFILLLFNTVEVFAVKTVCVLLDASSVCRNKLDASSSLKVRHSKIS